MTVREIVRAYLVEHGYDGLAGEECGCWLVDLMPCCDGAMPECVPGREETATEEDTEWVDVEVGAPIIKGDAK